MSNYVARRELAQFLRGIAAELEAPPAHGVTTRDLLHAINTASTYLIDAEITK